METIWEQKTGCLTWLLNQSDFMNTHPAEGMTIVIAWINADCTRSAVVWLNEGILVDAYTAFNYAGSMCYPVWDVFIFDPADKDCLRKVRRLIDCTIHE